MPPRFATDALLLAALLIGAMAADVYAQARVEYAGGTATQLETGSAGSIELSDTRYLAVYSKKNQVRIPYDRINLIEYGQQVERRLALAVIISPAFLLSKKRKHFLTLGYTDDAGRQQAMVFRVDKSGIRATLVSLEDRKSTRLNSSHIQKSRMPSSA